MAIFSTTISGTHTNTVQTSAIFNTRIIEATGKIIIVEATILQEGTQVGHSDFELDLRSLTHDVNVNGQAITLTGKLEFLQREGVVTFSGSLVFPGQVQVTMSPIIIAAF